MILRHIKISGLTALTSSVDYASWKHVPISPARAYSQSLNPNAHPDDIALIIALDDENKNILGFIGAFPSKTQKPEAVRVVWVSNWWVVENVRGQGIASILFNSFLEVWGNMVAIPDLTVKTLKIIKNLGLFHTMEREGVLLYIRPGFVSRLRILSYSSRKFNIISKPALYTGLPWLTDQLINLLLYFPQLYQFRAVKVLKPLKLRFPEEKDFAFMREHGACDFQIPETAELEMPDWLVKPSRRNRNISEKYNFSIFAFNFTSFWLRWESNGTTNALVMLSLRDGVLKTHYIYCEKHFRNELAIALLRYCFENPGIRTLMTAQPILTVYISERKFFILSRKNFLRYSAVSKDLMNNFDNALVLQDGDGDYRFT
jgi:hypothetical protein